MSAFVCLALFLNALTTPVGWVVTEEAAFSQLFSFFGSYAFYCTCNRCPCFLCVPAVAFYTLLELLAATFAALSMCQLLQHCAAAAK
jgi:hypothetical protein